MLITKLVVSFCKDGRGSVNVKLWFLVMCVLGEVLCRLVVETRYHLQPSDKQLHTEDTPLRTIILH